MKIGIISINAHTKVLNFASPLHSYAFQQFLKMHGYDSVIIDYKPNYYGQYNPRHPLFYQLSHPMKNKKKQRAALKKWLKLFIPRQIRFDKFQRFIDKYYITTDECYNENTLDTNDLGLDCYICATDVIWKCNKKAGFDRGFFLACDSMKGKYKIAYAASRGPVVELEEDKRKTFIEYISQFQNISIREKSFGEYIKRISGIENQEEYLDMQDELIDRFGELPRSVENLLKIADLKALAHQAGVVEVDVKKQDITIQMYQKANLDVSGIPALMEKYKGTLTFRTGDVPSFYYRDVRQKHTDCETMLVKAREILSGLAALAKE